MVIAKKIVGADNNSYMYEFNLYPDCCELCHYSMKQMINPNFRFSKKRYDDAHINAYNVEKHYDVSYTGDHYLIVSQKLVDFCQERQYQNVIFHNIPSEPAFYFLESNKILSLDYNKHYKLPLKPDKIYINGSHTIKFGNLCPKCNRYDGVNGVPFAFRHIQIEENSFYRSEYEFGNFNYKSPLIIVSLQMAKDMQKQKFRGLYFNDILDELP